MSDSPRAPGQSPGPSRVLLGRYSDRKATARRRAMTLHLAELQGALFKLEQDMGRVREDIAQIRRFANAAAESDLLPEADLRALARRCRAKSSNAGRTWWPGTWPRTRTSQSWSGRWLPRWWRSFGASAQRSS